MKKLFILFACVSVLLSCGNKDDNGGKTSQEVFFIEPILNFGASRATIKEQEKQPLFGEDANGVMYQGSNKELIFYLFENERLIASSIILPLSTNPEKVFDFLSSRYDIIGEMDKYLVWESKKRQLTIPVSVEIVGIIVMYMPTSLFLPPKTQTFRCVQLTGETTPGKIRTAIRQLIH